jgi:hypothetical protein
MQLEAGKRYTDRRGRVYGPLVANHALFGECRENYTWSIDGRVSQCREYDIDLVAEYVEPVQPEYRMLDAGEIIKADDEWKDGLGWSPVCGGVGRPFNSHIHVPHRRRKDLPPVPPKTRTVVLQEWICWDDDYPEAVVTQWFSTDPSVNAGLAAEYGHAVATGETRTVEIPVT